jgi:hypothetical protein
MKWMKIVETTFILKFCVLQREIFNSSARMQIHVVVVVGNLGD